MSGHIARKRFGQHFLVDLGILDAIIRSIAPKADDLMLEIGPGLGAMTDLLLPNLNCLHVVELDRDLAARLRKRGLGEHLIIHEQDVLAFDFSAWSELNRKQTSNRRIARIVGNLPYNISTPLLFHLLSIRDQVIDQHFMLQKEVIDRMVAAPGESGYGRLSVMLQLYYHMENVLYVPPSAFDPPPRVDSAIVRMIPYEHPRLKDINQVYFAQLVSAAFSQRRKMLRNTLSNYLQHLTPDEVPFDITLRAEALSLEDYLNLCCVLQTKNCPN